MLRIRGSQALSAFRMQKLLFQAQQLTTQVEQIDCEFQHLVHMSGDACLLYTSPSPRDATLSRMPSSA